MCAAPDGVAVCRNWSPISSVADLPAADFQLGPGPSSLATPRSGILASVREGVRHEPSAAWKRSRPTFSAAAGAVAAAGPGSRTATRRVAVAPTGTSGFSARNAPRSRQRCGHTATDTRTAEAPAWLGFVAQLIRWPMGVVVVLKVPRMSADKDDTR